MNDLLWWIQEYEKEAELRKKLEERLSRIHKALEEVADDIDTYGAKDATKLRAAWKAANED